MRFTANDCIMAAAADTSGNGFFLTGSWPLLAWFPPERSCEIRRFSEFLAFDLTVQLRYWAGPPCCRNLRRLTLVLGARVARKRIGYRRGIVQHASLTGQVELERDDLRGDNSREGLHHMIYLNAAPARPASRTLAAIVKTTTAGVFAAAVALATSSALAQQPAAPAPAAPAAKPAPAKKPPAKPAAPAPAAPAAPAPEAQQQAPAQGEQQQQVQLIYSPWTKFCLKGQNNDPNAKQVCFTGKDARIESGMPVVAAVLIEPEADPKKILRVTLPLGMQLVHGTRVIVDQNQPMTAPYVICFTNGCMADYDASGDLIGKMKKGQGLVIQAINSTGQPISLVLPLADFGKAYDGPPTDPKVFEEQQKKLQEELQRRADEARKKLESQQGQPQSSNPPPATAPQASGKP
jgi:invasion protein IalB